MHISFKIFCSSSKLSYKTLNRFSAQYIFAQSQNTNFDTIFVRHAHSQFNKACQTYRLKNKLQYDWDKLVNHQGFANAVAFNPDLIDAPLTQKGHQQCYLTSKTINMNEFDVIMVSPHYRALQTCKNLLKFSNLKERKIPVIVQPLIAGSLWSSCDVSGQRQKRLKEFQNFNFKKLQQSSDLWFIQNLSKKEKDDYYSQLSKRKLYSFRDKQLLTLEMLRKGKINENCQNLRNRAWKIKKMMQLMKEKHQTILIISHYYIIQYVNTKAFNQMNNKPLDDVDLKNCYPYYNTLSGLMNYK